MDRPGECLAWRSVDGSTPVPNRGVVRFSEAPGERGTEVQVELKYGPPAGAVGATFAKLFGEEPGQQIASDLRRLKQVLETGEVLHSDASIHRGLHPARPARTKGFYPTEGSCRMKANCWMGKKKVSVENVPDPKILNSHDAIIRVTSTAICGSDLHLYNGFVPTMERGDVLGHEFMGEVVEVGSSVKKLRVGDRVVVPFPIACGKCYACQQGTTSLCENSNPNAWMAEKMWGHSPCGIYGYSHLLGGFAGGQAEYARVPFADVGPIKVPAHLSDEQVLFLSDIFPTGYMGAEMCDIQPGQVDRGLGRGTRRAIYDRRVRNSWAPSE